MKLPAFLSSFAEAIPDREAVCCGNARLSFAQLHEQSSRLACGLAALGVATGERVAICLHNRVEFVVAFAAVVKAGAIAVTLNPRLATRELEHIFADCRPRAVFFENGTRAAVACAGVESALTINVDETTYVELLSTVGELPEVPVDFDDCQITYTSGTTGKPKGAVITQSNYITSNAWLNASQWGMTREDRVLVTTPLAHRTAFSRLMNTFLIGSSIVIMTRFDAKEAARLIEEEHITLLGMVPTVGRMLMPEIEQNPARFANLRLAVVTGEAFPVELKQRMQELLPNLKLYSFFASTEASAMTLLGPEEQISKGASTGRMNPGVEVKLVNEEDVSVAVGEVGEILVRSGVPGRYLTMREYFNNPAATADAFQDGWFRTGDLGRLDSDGYLYIVDRKKDMVLSGGYNIYSKEVEAAIAQIAGVEDVAVVGVPDPIFGESVAAFIQLKPGAQLASAQVIEHCRTQLASYKKPKHVHFLEELPRNSSGKVLKFELRALWSGTK